MFKLGKHQNVYSRFLNLFTNKKILFALLAIAIVAILAPTISFATEVMATQGDTLPEKVENAINKIIAEADVSPAAPNEDMSNYLTFAPSRPGFDNYFILHKHGNPVGEDIQISTNGTEWMPVIPETEINVDEPVFLRGDNPNGFSSSTNDYWNFVFYDDSFDVDGNIMSLINNGVGPSSTIPNEYCFYSLFSNAQLILTAPLLPATELKAHCYDHMFYNSGF